MFEGELSRNITLDDPGVSDVELYLQKAKAAGFVAELDGGLSAHVGERGVTLSGGQKQRVRASSGAFETPAHFGA